MKRAGIGAPVVGCGKLPRGMGMAFQLENDSFQSILQIIIFFIFYLIFNKHIKYGEWFIDVYLSR